MFKKLLSTMGISLLLLSLPVVASAAEISCDNDTTNDNYCSNQLSYIHSWDLISEPYYSWSGDYRVNQWPDDGWYGWEIKTGVSSSSPVSMTYTVYLNSENFHDQHADYYVDGVWKKTLNQETAPVYNAIGSSSNYGTISIRVIDNDGYTGADMARVNW